MSSDLAELHAYAGSVGRQAACYANYKHGKPQADLAAVLALAAIKAHWGALNRDEQAAVFIGFLAASDQPHRHRVQLAKWLTDYCTLGAVMFDGQSARRAHLNLPDRFSVYRGVSQLENRKTSYGVSWTMDEGIAEHFAKRLHDQGHSAHVLSISVTAEDVRGLLYERDEQEVLLVLDVTAQPAWTSYTGSS